MVVRTRNALKKDSLVGQTGGKNNELYLLDTPDDLDTSLAAVQGLESVRVAGYP